MRLVEGSCDLLIAYHHVIPADPARCRHATKCCPGARIAVPLCEARRQRRGRCTLCLVALGQPVPYLAYAPGAYLGRVLDQVLKQGASPLHLDRIYETDMAEGLKAMALEGHGIAFLPASAVRKRAAGEEARICSRWRLGSRTRHPHLPRTAPRHPEGQAGGAGVLEPTGGEPRQKQGLTRRPASSRRLQLPVGLRDKCGIAWRPCHKRIGIRC
jgi:DNA-binding transcriptional LysR family regulator